MCGEKWPFGGAGVGGGSDGGGGGARQACDGGDSGTTGAGGTIGGGAVLCNFTAHSTHFTQTVIADQVNH